MRGPSKTPPKYRKHKASGQAIVSIDGKDFYLGPHGTHASRIEYDRRIGEWLANGRQLPTCSKSITIVELVAQYWKKLSRYKKCVAQETRHAKLKRKPYWLGTALSRSNASPTVNDPGF